MRRKHSTVTSGCHHIALGTPDLDRFIEFFCLVFDAEVAWKLHEGPMSHALVDLGGGFHLHPFELATEDGGLPSNARASGTGDGMFQRGRLDHLAIEMADRPDFESVAVKLVEMGSSAGNVTDFGVVEVLPFTDPDGGVWELALSGNQPVKTYEQRTERWITAGD
jgi:catechol 2,3-dioxygenase-like lactoylglutathione lyase family enzyme